MTDNPRTAVAAGLAAGYLLGRSKKAKVALALVSFAAGRRLPLSPRELALEGVRKLRASAQYGQLSEQVRGELLTSGRSAVTAMVSRELEAFADVLGERTRALGGDGREQGRVTDRNENSHQAQEPQEPGAEDETATEGRRGLSVAKGARLPGPDGQHPDGEGESDAAIGDDPAARAEAREEEATRRSPATSAALGRRRPGEPLSPRRTIPKRAVKEPKQPSSRAQVGGEDDER